MLWLQLFWYCGIHCLGNFASFVIGIFILPGIFKELKINIIEIAYLFFSTISFYYVDMAYIALLYYIVTINAFIRKDIPSFSILGNNVY